MTVFDLCTQYRINAFTVTCANAAHLLNEIAVRCTEMFCFSKTAMPPKRRRVSEPQSEQPQEVAEPQDIQQQTQEPEIQRDESQAVNAVSEDQPQVEQIEIAPDAQDEDAEGEIDEEAFKAALEEEEKHYRLFAEDYFDSLFSCFPALL